MIASSEEATIAASSDCASISLSSALLADVSSSWRASRRRVAVRMAWPSRMMGTAAATYIANPARSATVRLLKKPAPPRNTTPAAAQPASMVTTAGQAPATQTTKAMAVKTVASGKVPPSHGCRGRRAASATTTASNATPYRKTDEFVNMQRQGGALGGILEQKQRDGPVSGSVPRQTARCRRAYFLISLSGRRKAMYSPV